MSMSSGLGSLRMWWGARAERPRRAQGCLTSHRLGEMVGCRDAFFWGGVGVGTSAGQSGDREGSLPVSAHLAGWHRRAAGRTWWHARRGTPPAACGGSDADDGESPVPAGAGHPTLARADFTLKDQTGQTVSLSSLRGQVVVITFMDPQCQSLCPINAQDLSVAEADLAPNVKPVLLVVSVAPDRTPADVSTFVSHVTWRPGWHWLLGNQAQLQAVWATWSLALDGTDVVHQEIAHVINQAGDGCRLLQRSVSARRSRCDHHLAVVELSSRARLHPQHLATSVVQGRRRR